MSAQIFARLESHTRVARRCPSGGRGGKGGGSGSAGNGLNNIELSSSTLPTSTCTPLLSSSSPFLNDLLRTRIPSFNFVLPPPVLSFDPFEGQGSSQEEEEGGEKGEPVELEDDEDGAADEEEDGAAHPLGEKNEEGKLAEEGMRRVVGWREEVKGPAGRSSLGLKGIKELTTLDPRRSSFPTFFPRDPWSTENTPASSPRPTYDLTAEAITPQPSTPILSPDVTRRVAQPPTTSSAIESPFNIPLPAPPPPPDCACNALDLLSSELGVGLGLELAKANAHEETSSSPSSSANSSYEDESEIDTPLSLRHTVLLPTVSLSFNLPPITLAPPPPSKALALALALAVASASSPSSSIDRENPFGFPIAQDAKPALGNVSSTSRGEDVSEGESRALTTGGAGGRRRSWAEVAAGKKEKRFCVFGFEE